MDEKARPFELGLRFLTDHLAGDVYFKVEEHNQSLHRARVQFRLAESVKGQRVRPGGHARRIALGARLAGGRKRGCVELKPGRQTPPDTRHANALARAHLPAIRPDILQPEPEVAASPILEEQLERAAHGLEREIVPGDFLFPEQAHFQAFGPRGKALFHHAGAEESIDLGDMGQAEQGEQRFQFHLYQGLLAGLSASGFGEGFA